jgi:predicted transcriptional regulator
MVKNKIRLLVSLTPEQVRGLKQLARRTKEPFAHHVRVAVQQYLTTQQQPSAKEPQ